MLAGRGRSWRGSRCGGAPRSGSSPARGRLGRPLDGGGGDRGELVVGGGQGRRGLLVRWSGDPLGGGLLGGRDGWSLRWGRCLLLLRTLRWLQA